MFHLHTEAFWYKNDDVIQRYTGDFEWFLVFFEKNKRLIWNHVDLESKLFLNGLCESKPMTYYKTL